MTINKNITIQGKSKDKVILDAEGLSRIFTINNNLNVTFINLTFTNAYFNGQGGAIFNNYIYTTMTFINCTFLNNDASSNGGAIRNNGNNMSLSNCNFINNTAVGSGAIFISGASNVTIFNCSFINNTGSNGAAIYIQGGSNFSVINSIFDTNIAISGAGGAIAIDSCVNSNIIGSTFLKNNASGNGGAITSNTNTSIINSTFMNNTGNNGAAIRINNNGNATISGNVIQGNNGDGIYVGNGNVTIIENNITDNTVGINNNGNATLDSNTILNNLNDDIINNGDLNPNGNNNIMDISQSELSLINIDVSANKVTITVKATANNGSLIVGRTINFYVNGVLVGSAITNSEGIGELTYTVSNYGQQNIVATLDEFNETFDFEGIADFAIRLYPAATNTTSVNVAEEKVPDNSTPDDDDTPTPKPDIDPRPNPDTIPELINDSNDNPVAKAAMKNTGIPIAILLVIALLGVVTYRRKN